MAFLFFFILNICNSNLGITKRENQRTRLLLKILAVSDVIIYRTRAERLPKDLYTFLGGASEVYKKHFSSALQKVLARSEGDRINTGQSSLLLEKVCQF